MPNQKGPPSQRFKPGDHVWMKCQTVANYEYEHHGIVVKASDNYLRVADFTAPDAGTFALPTSITSNSLPTAPSLSWHGVRVTTYENVGEWHKKEYEEAEADTRETVLLRVKFLVQNPHLVPAYEVLECNCETVAMWCKTGQFRTAQVSGLIEGGKRNSAVATGLAAAASTVLGPLPLIVSAGVWTALSSKQHGNETSWKERTTILNSEFEVWRKGDSCAIL